MTCWSPTCGKAIDPAAAACAFCGALLRIRDKYRVLRLIGQGGMGVVYEAVDERLGRHVALKMMHGRHAEHSSTRQRFETECRAMAALDHPGIARIYDADAYHDQLFFVQQLVPGKTLRQALAEWTGASVAPSRDAILAIGLELLEALGHAHEHGVIHRDVNLNNVMLIERGGGVHPILIDFGMARLSEPSATRAAWGGTPGFAAPEQILDPQSNDCRSDLFAVAMVLYALFAGGTTAYASTLNDDAITSPTSLVEAYRRIAAGTTLPTPLTAINPAVPPALAQVIMRGVAARLDERFQTASEMADALRACLVAAEPRPAALPASLELSGPDSSPPLSHAPTAAVSTDSLSSFAGRARELERLEGLLAAALGGVQTACFVTGDAGTGKTALVREFARRAQARHEGLQCAFGKCRVLAGTHDPFLPFRDALVSLVGGPAEAGAGAAAQEERVVRLRGRAGKLLLSVAPRLVGHLVQRSQLPSWLIEAARPVETAELSREALFAMLTDFVRALTQEAPLVLVLDNLQWVDSASIDLLWHLGHELHDARILFVGIYRPGEIVPQEAGRQHPLEPLLSHSKRQRGDVWIDLDEVGLAERRAFVDALLDRQPNLFSPAFRSALFDKTQGNAMFVVELLRAMQKEGLIVEDAEGRWVEAPGLKWPSLPRRVEGVVEQQIRRLDEDLRETLTVASVAGREFIAQAVAMVRNRPARDLLRQLTQDLDRKHRLVHEIGARRTPQGLISEFRFRNVVVQQYLCDQLSESERIMLHGDIANALEKLFGEAKDEIALTLAEHFDAAGESDKAIAYLQKAADWAMGLSAYEEAARCSERALVLLREKPASDERAQIELGLTLKLASALKISTGWASARTKHAYDRALELCRRVGNDAALAPALFGMWSYYLVGADLRKARQIGEKLAQIGASTKDTAVQAIAETALANCAFWLGEIDKTLEHALAATKLHRTGWQPEDLERYGLDPNVIAQMLLAWASWLKGMPETAKRVVIATRAEVDPKKSPFGAAIALTTEAWIGQHQHDVKAALETSTQLTELSRERGFPSYLGLGTMLHGWALAEEGRAEEGVLEIRKGFDAWRASAGELTLTFASVLLGEALWKAGKVSEALEVVREGLEKGRAREELPYQPELLRLSGELLAASCPPALDEAALRFREAFALARKLGAHAFALRAALGLARLGVERGAPSDGRALLRDAMAALFEEGESLREMAEARRLLG